MSTKISDNLVIECKIRKERQNKQLDSGVSVCGWIITKKQFFNLDLKIVNRRFSFSFLVCRLWHQRKENNWNNWKTRENEIDCCCTLESGNEIEIDSLSSPKKERNKDKVEKDKRVQIAGLSNSSSARNPFWLFSCLFFSLFHPLFHQPTLTVNRMESDVAVDGQLAKPISSKSGTAIWLRLPTWRQAPQIGNHISLMESERESKNETEQARKAASL